jgi:hypothetical protein
VTFGPFVPSRFWEQHARRQLPRRIERALDGAHLVDSVVAVEFPKELLLQGAPSHAMLGERRAAHRDHASRHFQNRFAPPFDVIDRSRYDIGMQVAV